RSLYPNCGWRHGRYSDRPDTAPIASDIHPQTDNETDFVWPIFGIGTADSRTTRGYRAQKYDSPRIPPDERCPDDRARLLAPDTSPYAVSIATMFAQSRAALHRHDPRMTQQMTRCPAGSCRKKSMDPAGRRNAGD